MQTPQTNTRRALPTDRIIGRQLRVMAISREAINVEARSVEIAFSSETPVPRWWGNEILGHAPGEADLVWMESGRAPLLMDHNPRDQVGVVASVKIGTDRKGRAVVRFGTSARADEIFKDVCDGVRSNISVGYEIKDLQLVAETDGESTYRAVSWCPLEISFVAMPADQSVGVGRGEQAENSQPVTLRAKDPSHMETTMTTATALAAATALSTPAAAAHESQIRASAGKDFAAQATEILAIADKLNVAELGRRAISQGVDLNTFRQWVLDDQFKRNVTSATPATPPAQIGLSERETKSYSLIRAIAAAASGDWSQAGFERECSDAVAKRTGEQARGFFVPFDLLVSPQFLRGLPMQGQRDNVVGTASAGGNLVATQLLEGSFIELLRARSGVTALGARMLPGLVGNVDIPRQITAATAGWVAEQAAQAKSNATFDKVTLTPKTITAQVQISRNMMKQSTPAIDALVRDDLTKVIALGLDDAALNGTGASNQPRGVRNQVGISVVALGTNGANIDWTNIVLLETNVAQANADLGNLAYLTNPKQRGKMKTTVKFASTASPIWEAVAGAEAGEGSINGYRARASAQVPSTLTKGSASGICSNITFGNWSELLIGMWGALDLQVDPYTAGNAGDTIIRVFQTADVAVRHVPSFSIIEDAL
jgi:HK97 family phage major capsid protein